MRPTACGTPPQGSTCVEGHGTQFRRGDVIELIHPQPMFRLLTLCLHDTQVHWDLEALGLWVPSVGPSRDVWPLMAAPLHFGER
jgi:hypothetical protein